jgi:hypothetical protein
VSNNTLSEVEAGLNAAGAIGAAMGGPVGAAVDAGLQGAEGVVNTVVAQAPHQTALTDIQNAVKAAAPVIAAAPIAPAQAAQVATGLSLIEQMIAFLKGIF